VAGGDADPNLHSLLRVLQRERRRCLPMLVGSASHPALTWDLQKDEVRFQGKRVQPSALFIRHDVFTNLNDGRYQSGARAYAWFTAIASWAAAHPDVKMLNRHHSAHLLKPQQLMEARRCGLEIPKTLITNDFSALEKLDAAHSIAKPVAGGDYCRSLSSVLRATERRGRAAASPAIVQEKLVQPEMRVYRVGKRFLSYRIASTALDYRTTNDCVVTPAANQPSLIRPLRRLMNLLRLDFGAADFKTSPVTGRYVFLEVNTSPMFAAFDAVSDMAVSKAIAEFLVE
jgi:glutathione synthase/RimK-type ligase-like ATP-grasp enzyme